jgi:hypothetical protein
MPTVQAKLFEWHRVDTDAKAVRVLLRDALARGDSQQSERLSALLERLETTARDLLADMETQRAKNAGEQCRKRA